MSKILGIVVFALTIAFGGIAKAQSYDWNGLYIGLHAGHGDADVDWTFNNVGGYNNAAGDTFSSGPDGYLVGGQVGYQHQWGNLVAGVEVSYSATGMDETSVSPFFPATDALSSDVDNLVHVVGRLGYSWNNVLAYVKGGYAGANVKTVANFGVIDAFRSQEWENGWTVGGGVEWAFTKSFSLAIDYSYTDLGENTRVGQGVNSAGVPNGIDESINVDSNIHAVTARLNFKLGGHGRQSTPLK